MPQKEKTVLVVDDLEANRYAVCRILPGANYITAEAATGSDAVEGARRLRPDAIVLDMNLPDQTGVTTLKQLRGEIQTAFIPVVFLSATAQSPCDRSHAEAAGASAYLFSPVQADTLICVLKGVIERGVHTLNPKTPS
jgi:CheY-like chemotaxis protein